MRRGDAQSRAERDAAFRRAVDEVKQQHNVSDVIGRKTILKRSGREMRGLCPVHSEKSPSLYVNDNLGVFLCRGCGWSGDIIQAVRDLEGMTFREAVEWLGGDVLPKADPAQRAKAAARDEVVRSAYADAAVDIWHRAQPVAGTFAEIYLRSRGINSWPETIRFAPTWAWMDEKTGETGPDIPALIGCVENDRGVIGIQRIFLLPDGTGKARMKKPKLSLGNVRGGALRLGPPAPVLLICEGPEDGLSLRQELPGQSVWVALGTANMPAIRYPEIVRKIVICSQNDAAAEISTRDAAGSLIDQGYLVEVRHPRPEFKDWNDQLMGRAR